MTSNRDSEAIVEAVREQYEAFPYPPIDSIEQEDFDRDLRKSFNLEFRLAGERTINPGARVWVPGCGTRWAVMLALQFKDVEIVATDLSHQNLQRQAALAQSLELSQIDFRQEDLLKAHYHSEFDFISCVGVLHHLPDPDEGFRVLSRALKHTGLAEIMVYDEMNRRYSKRIREIIRTFDPLDSLNSEARFDLAVKILKSINKHASAPRELSRILQYLENQPNFRCELADYISHPQEHYFSVPSLLRSLRSAGLKPRAWRPPERFDPKFMLSNPDLHRQLNAMDEERSTHLAHLLGAGLLELFVEHADAPICEPQQNISGRMVRSMEVGLVHRIRQGQAIPQTERQSKLHRKEGELYFDAGPRRPAVAAYGVNLDCIKPEHRRLLRFSDLDFDSTIRDEHIEALVKISASPITIGEIAEVLSEDKSILASRVEIERVCDRLCRTPVRMLAMV